MYDGNKDLINLSNMHRSWIISLAIIPGNSSVYNCIFTYAHLKTGKNKVLLIRAYTTAVARFLPPSRLSSRSPSPPSLSVSMGDFAGDRVLHDRLRSKRRKKTLGCWAFKQGHARYYYFSLDFLIVALTLKMRFRANLTPCPPC